MKIVALIVSAVIFTASAFAKSDYGKIQVITNGGDSVVGYTAPLMADERTTLKVSSMPDSKKSEKISVKNVVEVRYYATGDTLPELWFPCNIGGDKLVLAKRVGQTRHAVLWKAPVSGEHKSGHRMRFVIIRDFIGFDPTAADGVIWDVRNVAKGKCGKSPEFKDFVKLYKKTHSDINPTEVDNLMQMCDAYVDSLSR